MKVPELLCPAGNRESLEAALHFGADAVYGGMKHYGLRAYAGNFDGGELYFSRTLAEHERAVNAYRNSWEQYDQSRGIQ